jgi:enoyl-CoA hydratase
MEINQDRYRFIRFDRKGAVLRVTMDSPPLNAAAYDLHQELSTVFYELAADPCRIVVLTGEGRAFSAGGDFDDMLRNCDDPIRQSSLLARAPHIGHSMLALDKPVIARVNGHAMGLGATLALLCDVAIMVDKARIADPHVNIGMSAGDGGALLWPLMIGFARARHYLFTGDALTGTEAAELGLVLKAVPAEDLDNEVDASVERLLKVAPRALNGTKRSINMVLRQMLGGLAEAHVGIEQLTMNTHDHREALLALKDKREPRFTGN